MVSNSVDSKHISCHVESQRRSPRGCRGTRHSWGSTGAEASFGDCACPHLEEERACNTHTCAGHCVVSDFSAWTTCTKSCGSGAQSRSRSITTEATYGGYACPYLDEPRATSYGCT